MMGTRSYIFVKIRKEDKEKSHKANLDKIPLLHYISSDLIKDVYINKESNYIGMYSSHEGYPEGIGKVLYEKFNTYESAINLILGGNVINITGGDWDPYISESNWESEKPTQIFEIAKTGVTVVEYIYLFDGQWWVSHTTGTIEPLKKHGKIIVKRGDLSWISLRWFLNYEEEDEALFPYR